MKFSANFVRNHLSVSSQLEGAISLKAARMGQEKFGELMQLSHKKDVYYKHHAFSQFEGIWVIPKDELRQGVILYIHGGGYISGGVEYAKSFGTTLSYETGAKVFCSVYRLAPEHPFPAALEDSYESYMYLLEKGYKPSQITIVGESAGGGLVFSLCLLLKQRNVELPSGVIAISPWTDFMATGASYEFNKTVDPTISKTMLEYYSSCYADDYENPLVSPLLGDLTNMPPALIFVGGDEVMLDDSTQIHEKLIQNGCKSKLIVTPERWHIYLLYNLIENDSDFVQINQFLDNTAGNRKKLNWLKLDNAAKIYPAALRKNWSNIFRLSATLNEEVDIAILRSALDVTMRRFPSMAVRVRRGFFWFYLERVKAVPQILHEKWHPLVHMPFDDINKCAFRVIAHENRIAVEFFHAVTDGSGGLVFLKTLLAEYISQKYNITIQKGEGVLGRLDEPSVEELQDSFLKHSSSVSASRKEKNAFRMRGTPEKDGFINLVTMVINTQEIKTAAKRYNASVTEFLTAVMMKAILNIQEETLPKGRRKPVKVLVPINLRNLFPSTTLRNFALYATPEADAKLGTYDIQELCTLVKHHMGAEATPKRMAARIRTNVKSEQSPFLKVMPLFIKNIAMKTVYNSVGERKSCICMSNLGLVRLKAEMQQYVERVEFIIGVQALTPNNCGVMSYNGKTYINFIRNIKESALELKFFELLRDEGLAVIVESNNRD